MEHYDEDFYSLLDPEMLFVFSSVPFKDWENIWIDEYIYDALNDDFNLINNEKLLTVEPVRVLYSSHSLIELLLTIRIHSKYLFIV